MEFNREILSCLAAESLTPEQVRRAGFEVRPSDPAIRELLCERQ